MRGRTRSKGPNPLTRSYESNGPDVKIRGTAQHIADKYAQLARDATASGDPVSAENYHQHAEHYYRLIAAAQEVYRQQFGGPQRPFDEDGEEGEEDGAPQGGPYGYSDRQGGGAGPGADEFGEGPAQNFEPRGNDRQAGRYEGEIRQDRGPDRGPGPDRGGDRQRYDRNSGPDRGQRFDRNGGQDRGGQDRGGQDRGQRFDRGGERFDRGGERGGDRFDRGGSPPGDRYERGMNGGPNGGPGGGGDRYGQGQDRNDRPDRPDRQEGHRNGGREGGRRDFGRDRQPRGPEGGRFGPAPEETPEGGAGNLPAFLTNPVRPPIAMGEPEGFAPTAAPMSGPDDGGFEAPMNGAPEARPRRPRRPRRPEGEALDLGLGEAGDKPAE